MRNGIGQLIRKVHYSIPPGLRNYYKFLDDFIRWIRKHYMPVWQYVFKDGESDGLFTFVHIGWDSKLRHYWLNRFPESFEIVSESRKSAFWSITGFLEKNKDKIDLAIIESSKNPISNRYPKSFLLPRWMEMELDIEASLKKSRIKNIIRNIKKHSLNYEVREGIEAFDLFYHSMYRPFVARRHGKSSDMPDYRSFAGRFLSKGCSLFFIIKENEPVAAAFIEVKNSTYRLGFFGVKDGSDKIFKMGVIGALYYFVMLYYHERGINKILAGVSMPVLFDGVMESKMQIGARPYLKDIDGMTKFYFKPFNARSLTMKVLKSNPLFYISGSALNIAAFVSAEDFDTKEEFLKFLNRLKTENVGMTRFYYFDNNEKITQWIHEQGIANIKSARYEGETF